MEDKESIVIRPIAIDDFNEVLRWSRDEAFCLANEWELNRDTEELYDWWQWCVHNQRAGFVRMGIEWDHKLIGYADLANMKGSTTELGIAIGDSTLWGKGIGSLAANQFIEFASEKFNLSIIHAETHETNLRSQKMLKKLGFKEISRHGTESYLGVETKLIQYQLILPS